jgi:iron complex outermembrane receptor protein
MRGYLLLAAVSVFGLSNGALAQDLPAGEEAPADRSAATASLMDDIVVTAQKKSVGERAQDVPIAITAMGEAQLEALKVRSLGDLNAVSPNVTLDENGTVKGYANFTIRGSSQNSSVPSLEPGVGLFVDGVYQGVSAGSVSDNFDFSNVQILRGPQGTLFGRNVTGGAVLVETARPTDDFGGYLRASLETGLEYSLQGAVNVPLVPDTLTARVAGYYRKDEGWFTNEFDGSSFGKTETFIVRPTIKLETGALTQTFITEYGNVNGHGPALQARNPINSDPFVISLNDPGLTDRRWYSVTSETTIDVGFGDGTITNVLGYRNIEDLSRVDLDASASQLFIGNFLIDQSQWSNELRYAGRFGSAEITTGLYYLHQDLVYREARAPFVAGDRGGGGHQEQNSYGIFGQTTLHFTDNLNVIGGLRYSHEEKSAQIVRLTVGRCVDVRQICDFNDAPTVDTKRSWNSFSPKVGVNYKVNPDTLVYASFSKAVRSGGFNVRLSDPRDPGTYDQENLTAYEAGVKADLLDRSLRINLAGFINDFKGLQRTVSTFVGTSILQTIDNSADARIKGIELDITIQPSRELQFVAGVGYLKAHYTDIRADLSGDGVVDQKDYDLRLSRVPSWSVSAGAIYTREFASGAMLRGQLFYSHRSDQAGQDNNTVIYPDYEDLRADITFTLPNRATSLSVFGRNLTDEARNTGSNGPLGFPSGGFKDITEGRSLGVEVRHNF